MDIKNNKKDYEKALKEAHEKYPLMNVIIIILSAYSAMAGIGTLCAVKNADQKEWWDALSMMILINFYGGRNERE